MPDAFLGPAAVGQDGSCCDLHDNAAYRIRRVTRATLDGKHPEGWFPEQRLTVDEALRAYTQGSAYAAFAEKDKGTLAPGKLADVIVLSGDLFKIAPEKIRDVKVEMTIAGGQLVYK